LLTVKTNSTELTAKNNPYNDYFNHMLSWVAKHSTNSGLGCANKFGNHCYRKWLWNLLAWLIQFEY